MADKHYTMAIVVTETTEAKPAELDQYRQEKKPATPREAREVTKIIIRGKDLTELKITAKQHIDLIEDN